MSEHDAGRALDALIAEKVMGIMVTRAYLDKLVIEAWFIQARNEGHREYEIMMTDYYPVLVPRYSTDIAAAWEVVEKFNGQVTIQGPDSVGFNEGESYPHHWTVAFTDRAWDDIRGEADTTPLAICRAALKAVS